MAENNSSAPLKTTPMIEAFEAAYSRDWSDPAGDEIKEIWHRAWQAAAQAAPAAVAVPEWDKMRRGLAMLILGFAGRTDCTESAAEAVLDAATEPGMPLEGLRTALAATPALPATEDSSAGDLAAVQAEPVAWRYKRRGDCFGDFWFKPAGQSADDLRTGRGEGKVFARCQDHYDWTPLYTAPQAQPADALDAWQAIGSMPTCDDLIWLYCQDTNTIDGPVAPHPMYEDSWTHWAYAQAPSTTTIDAAMAAAKEGGNAAKEA